MSGPNQGYRKINDKYYSFIRRTEKAPLTYTRRRKFRESYTFCLLPKNIHYCDDTGLDKMLAYRILTFKKESWYNRGKEKKK